MEAMAPYGAEGPGVSRQRSGAPTSTSASPPQTGQELSQYCSAGTPVLYGPGGQARAGCDHPHPPGTAQSLLFWLVEEPRLSRACGIHQPDFSGTGGSESTGCAQSLETNSIISLQI